MGTGWFGTSTSGACVLLIYMGYRGHQRVASILCIYMIIFALHLSYIAIEGIKNQNLFMTYFKCFSKSCTFIKN